MNRLRKLMLACVTATALIFPLAQSAEAQSCQGYTLGHTRVYYVYVRACVHEQWRNIGGYYRAADAQAAVRYFQYRGYEAFYR